jgi:hypothetical protein
MPGVESNMLYTCGLLLIIVKGGYGKTAGNLGRICRAFDYIFVLLKGIKN